MASGAYQNGVKVWLDGTIDYLVDTIKVLLVSTATPYTYDPDHTIFDAGGANDIVDAETNVSGYTRGWGGAGRKTLASKTIAVDDTNDRVEVDAADVTWTALGTGETLEAAIIGKEGGANDTTSVPIVYLDPTNIPTNGSDVTLQFAATGFLHFNIV